MPRLPKTRFVSFRLDEPTLSRLAALSDAEDASRSEVIRRLIGEAVERSQIIAAERGALSLVLAATTPEGAEANQ